MSLFQRMMLKEVLPRIINQNRNAYTHENYRTQKRIYFFRFYRRKLKQDH